MLYQTIQGVIVLKQRNNKLKKINFKISSKPEKIIAATAISVAGAILFDQKKKKIKHPEKYHNFFQRTAHNYKIINGALDKTIAKDLYKKARNTYKSDVLRNLTIENGEFIDL